MVAKDEYASVRSAACTCIGELGSKMPPEIVRPFVPVLLASLTENLSDAEWTVRDGKKQEK